MAASPACEPPQLLAAISVLRRALTRIPRPFTEEQYDKYWPDSSMDQEALTQCATALIDIIDRVTTDHHHAATTIDAHTTTFQSLLVNHHHDGDAAAAVPQCLIASSAIPPQYHQISS